MPKIKRRLDNIVLPNEDELAIIEEFIKSKPEVKAIVNSLQQTFNKHFCFEDAEIRVYIYNICKDLEAKTVKDFNALFTSFAVNDVDDFDRANRQEIARGIIDNAIGLYKEENKNIEESFIEVLKEAKRQNIDPFKLAIKTNMQLATRESFLEAVTTLTKAKYHDTNLNIEQTLIEDDELKRILEKCPSVACKATESATAEILSLLNGLFWDKEKKGYAYDVRHIIKSTPSLLLQNPSDIAKTIEMLELFFADEGRDKLLARIKKSPSILMVDFNKVSKFNVILTRSIENILISKKDKTSEEKEPLKYAQRISDEFVLDLDHLTQIDKLKLEYVDDNAKILTKYLGEDNAIICLKNMTVLGSDPKFLECMLACIVQEDQLAHSTSLRQAFVSNPYAALTKVKESVKANKQKQTSDEELDVEKAPKESLVIGDFPEIFIPQNEFDAIKKRAGNAKSHDTSILLEKLKKNAEEMERLKKEEEERLAAERARLEEEARIADEARRERNRQARLEKKALKKTTSRRQIQNANRSIQYDSTSTSKPTVQTIELSLEEKQAKRREKATPIKPLPKEIKKQDVFRILYEPMIDAFTANGYYPRKLPSFNDISRAYETYIKALEKSQFNYDSHIKNNNLLLQNSTYGKISMIASLAQHTSSGGTILQKIVLENEAMLQVATECEKMYSSAFSSMNDSDKRADIKLQKINTNDNLFIKTNIFRENIGHYIDSIEAEAQNFFGEDYVKMFFPSEREAVLQDLIKTLTTQLNPQCYNSLIVEMYINDYYKIIFDELERCEIISVKSVDEFQKYMSNNPNKIVKNANNTPLPKRINPQRKQAYISASKCDELGIEKETVIKFCGQYQDLSILSSGKCHDVYLSLIPDTKDIHFIYFEDEENDTEMVYELKNGSPEYTGIPPVALFPKLNEEYKKINEGNNKDKNSSDGEDEGGNS